MTTRDETVRLPLPPIEVMQGAVRVRITNHTPAPPAPPSSPRTE